MVFRPTAEVADKGAGWAHGGQTNPRKTEGRRCLTGIGAHDHEAGDARRKAGGNGQIDAEGVDKWAEKGR